MIIILYMWLTSILYLYAYRWATRMIGTLVAVLPVARCRHHSIDFSRQAGKWAESAILSDLLYLVTYPHSHYYYHTQLETWYLFYCCNTPNYAMVWYVVLGGLIVLASTALSVLFCSCITDLISLIFCYCIAIAVCITVLTICVVAGCHLHQSTIWSDMFTVCSRCFITRYQTAVKNTSLCSLQLLQTGLHPNLVSNLYIMKVVFNLHCSKKHVTTGCFKKSSPP